MLPSELLFIFAVDYKFTKNLTTQKANEEFIFTTQKEEEATQKAKNTTQKPLTATQNAILDYLKTYTTATRQEIASALGGNFIEDGVKYKIF